jgi:hypothetical protein
LKERALFNHLQYVPILKWKLGEYQALARLENAVKDRVTPLIELPAVGYDFENSRVAKSLDDHLKDFGRRLKSKWAARPCFVDTKNIAASERLADGSHPLTRVIELARSEGCGAIPVAALSSDAAYRDAAARAVLLDERGAALRIVLEDFDRPSLVADIERCLQDVGVGFGSADLVVDLCDKHFLPVTAFVQTLLVSLQRLPSLNRWRTFTVAGSSYPKTLQDIGRTAMVPRREWALYRELVGRLGSDMRIPTFGDYAVAHPDPVELDMRLIKPFAKLRYTTPEDWYIAKGSAVRTSGFDQYRGMCDVITRQTFFDGAAFSDGDRYIAECAAGTETTGNLTTWVWVSSNRHITRVVADISTFHGA